MALELLMVYTKGERLSILTISFRMALEPLMA
jgi:hypothetical protein